MRWATCQTDDGRRSGVSCPAPSHLAARIAQRRCPEAPRWTYSPILSTTGRAADPRQEGPI
jgi:hypothetical protein